jgi:hypothetical protein
MCAADHEVLKFVHVCPPPARHRTLVRFERGDFPRTGSGATDRSRSGWRLTRWLIQELPSSMAYRSVAKTRPRVEGAGIRHALRRIWMIQLRLTVSAGTDHQACRGRARGGLHRPPPSMPARLQSAFSDASRIPRAPGTFSPLRPGLICGRPVRAHHDISLRDSSLQT